MRKQYRNLSTVAFPMGTLLLVPSLVLAQTLSQAVGYLNILVGLMLVAAFLCEGVGLAIYLGRFALVGRDWGIQIMSWGVAILFVLVIMLWGIQFIQNHTVLAIEILALVILAVGGKFVIQAVRAAPSGEDHH